MPSSFLSYFFETRSNGSGGRGCKKKFPMDSTKTPGTLSGVPVSRIHGNWPQPYYSRVGSVVFRVLSDCHFFVQHWQRHGRSVHRTSDSGLGGICQGNCCIGRILFAPRSGMTNRLSSLLLTTWIMCGASVGCNIFQCGVLVSLMNFSCLGVLLRRVVPDRRTISQGA